MELVSGLWSPERQSKIMSVVSASPREGGASGSSDVFPRLSEAIIVRVEEFEMRIGWVWALWSVPLHSCHCPVCRRIDIPL